MKSLGLEHTVHRLGKPIQKPVKRVTFSSGNLSYVWMCQAGFIVECQERLCQPLIFFSLELLEKINRGK